MSKGISTSTINVDVTMDVTGQGTSTLADGTPATQRITRITQEDLHKVTKILNPLTLEVHEVQGVTTKYMAIKVQGVSRQVPVRDVLEGFFAVWGP